MTTATTRQVKTFLRNVQCLDLYNPEHKVVSFKKGSHPVLADGETIYVFIHGRYTFVGTTIKEWKSKCKLLKDESMAAFRIWLTA